MALSRSNGTTDIEQKKFFRNNGTTDIQIGKMFRSDGTADCLIYPEKDYFFPNIFGLMGDDGVGEWYTDHSVPTMNDGNLEINLSSDTGYWTNQESIDLDKYTKITFVVEEISSGGWVHIGVAAGSDATSVPTWGRAGGTDNLTTAGTYSCVMPKDYGTLYVSVRGGGTDGYIKFSEIYFE